MNSTNETKMDMKQAKQNNTPNIRWTLVGYDLIVYALVAVILLVLYGGMDKLSTVGIFQQVGLSVLCIFTARLIGKIYGQVWRYGGIQCYIRLLFTDSIAFVAYLCLELLLPVQKITFARLLSLVSLNLLGALALRMMYRYAYKCGNQETTRDNALGREEIYKKIQTLRDACDTGNDLIAKEALRSVVPTFKRPEEVNKDIA